MRACIIKLCSRTVLDKKRIMSIEVWHIRKWLLPDWDEVIVHTPQVNEAIDLPFAQYIEDLNEFDRVFVHASRANFFKGEVSPYMAYTSVLLAGFRGEVTYVVNDPAIVPVNFPRHILARKLVCDHNWAELADKMDTQMNERSNIMLGGSDYDGWARANKITMPQTCPEFSGFAKFTAQSNFKVFDIVDPAQCEYDMTYYGSNRSGLRNRKLKDYLSSVKSMCIGHKNADSDLCRNEPIFHGVLPFHLRAAAASTLIIGDPMHGTSWKTMRFFEAPWWGLLSFVDRDFGDHYDNELVKEHCYVSNGEELRDKVSRIRAQDGLWQELTRLQRDQWGIIDP